MSNIVKLHKKLVNKQLSATEVAKFYINRIEKYDNYIKTMLCKTPEIALDTAKKVDDKINKGEQISIIAGITFAVKDNIETKDIVTTAGSKMLENYIPKKSSFFYDNLIKNDALMLGKLNLDEFGVGAETISFMQQTLNPFNLNENVNGSSGGSAGFLAGGFGHFTIGTDTGGSIREPAGRAGVYGIKPTYNSIALDQSFGYANSLDTIGVLARNITDVAVAMEYCTANNPNSKNFTFVNYKDAYKKIEEDITGKIKVVIIKEINKLDFSNTDSRYEYEEYHKIVEALRKNPNYEVTEISIPEINETNAMYKVVTAFEMEKYMKALTKNNPDNITKLDKRIRQRIIMGEYYKEYSPNIINNINNKIKNLDAKYNDVMKNHDYILSPLSSIVSEQNIVTIANFTKSPAIALPTGISKNTNIPVGIQIFGKYKEDVRLLQLARKLEQIIGYNQIQPIFNIDEE